MPFSQRMWSNGGNLLQEGKLSLHSLTGYPTCEQARVYSTNARQNVSSSSDLKKKPRKGLFCNWDYTLNNTEKIGLKDNISIINANVLTYTQRSDTQLATKGFGSMFS